MVIYFEYNVTTTYNDSRSQATSYMLAVVIYALGNASFINKNCVLSCLRFIVSNETEMSNYRRRPDSTVLTKMISQRIEECRFITIKIKNRGK